ncbi:MAG: hypothetical protein M9920_09740 [Verrucomicrobiae bacterium]|nr:hypothetical protein [Verrucomicrobiae bacterium]
MNSILRAKLFPARLRTAIQWLIITLPLYVLSAGPVAWATNDAFHPRYLPDEIWMLYLPLLSLTRVEWIGSVFHWYTAILWQGFPAGYTTL